MAHLDLLSGNEEPMTAVHIVAEIWCACVIVFTVMVIRGMCTPIKEEQKRESD